MVGSQWYLYMLEFVEAKYPREWSHGLSLQYFCRHSFRRGKDSVLSPRGREWEKIIIENSF